MPELHRLVARSKRGTVSLVLTDATIQLEPDPEFRAEIEEGLSEGRKGAEQAPGVIGWIAAKAVGFAGKMVDRYFAPHSLADVELMIKHDRVQIKFGHMNIGSDLQADPTEAYIFDAKFRDAKEALERR